MTIIEFQPPQQEKYLDEMSRQELLDYLDQLEARIAGLDAREPRSMSGDAYERWAEEHEAVEDAIDEVRELLDEI